MRFPARKKRFDGQPQIALELGSNFYDLPRRHKLAVNGMRRVRRNEQVSTDR
jgi:hypothetical protein